MAKKKKDKTEYQKQRATVYTMMLIASFMALVLGCVVLYKELERYEFDYEAEEYKKNPAPVSLVVTDHDFI